MTFLRTLKSNIGAVDSEGVPRLWIVYYTPNHKIREIKSLYDPTNYTGKRPCYTDQELVRLLEEKTKN